MNPQSRGHHRRAATRLALLLACAVVASFACAGPALAAPGLTPLGGPQIGLPTGQQQVAAMVVHRGEAYAAVIEHRGASSHVQVWRHNPAEDAWLPVAGPLNDIDSKWVFRVSLLSTHAGELYAAWTEVDAHTASWRAVVARLTPHGDGWERIMQTPAAAHAHAHATVRLAQVGKQVWVAWNGTSAGVRLARITPGHIDALPAETFPPDAFLNGFAGYGDDAYVAYTQSVYVPAHRDQHGDAPAEFLSRLRMARLTPVPDRAGVQVTPLGSWDDVDDVFLTAGAPDASVRPILAWNTPQGIEVMRLRADGGGFDRIPVARLITLRNVRALRNLAATPAGITIAATSNSDANVRVYTLTEQPRHLTITDGNPLPNAAGFGVVTMAPAPRAADPGAVMLGYDRQSPGALRAAAMRYSP